MRARPFREPAKRSTGGPPARCAVPSEIAGEPPRSGPSVTITIRVRRPKAEIALAARPNVNGWVNKLIEQALGPGPVDWNEHCDHKSKQRRFRCRASEMRRGER